MDLKKIVIDKSIFEKDSMLATCSIFLTDAFFEISTNNESYIITVSLKNSKYKNLDTFISEFNNELILQQRKKDISIEFADIKSTIINSAFSPIQN